MSDNNGSDRANYRESWGEGLSLERPAARFVRTKSENQGFRDRVVWLTKIYRGSWAIARRFRSGSLGGPGDICLLYGRSYARLLPILRAAREKKMIVLLDVVEGVERFGGFGGALNPVRWDWVLGMRRLPLLVDGVTAISHGLAQRCRDQGVKNVRLVPGIESWSGNTGPEIGPKHRRFRLVHVGALLRKDAPGELIEFVRQLRHRGIAVEIDVCGRYEQSPEGRYWLAELQKVDQGSNLIVRFLGAISNEEMEKVFKEADGFLMFRADTIAERISFPTRLLEYLRQARPVFVTGVGDIPRYLEDGRDAVVLPVGDASAAAEKFGEFIVQPERLRAIGLAGWLQGCKCFDRNAHATKILTWARRLNQGAIHVE